MVGFNGYIKYCIGRRSLDDERKITRWKRIVSRIKGKLINMIKNVDGIFGYYSISPKTTHILLH